ncbi:glycosyltransferase family 4 protein [Acinetobacter schindleri]|uniref:glycosyltransferase family 4 protein n=1 Tax=Acinetobacter schindleri TaxID=108981 RepID=UPI0013B08A23|nr:glycosyltransferase family 4 protein [Acinetobacter schindleri]QIC61258.1 glycosyltransferase family 4 protein [Acinetobacter schindleri]
MQAKKIIIIGTTASNLYIFRKDFIVACIQKQMHVVAFVSEFTDEWVEKLSELGAEVVTYKLSRGGLNPLADIKSTIELTYKIKKIKPDIVLSYSAKPVIYGTLAAKAARVSANVGMLEGLGYTFTDQPEGQSFKTKFVRNIQVLLYKFAFKFMDKIIFLNHDDKKDLMDRYKIEAPKSYVLGGIGLNLASYQFSKAEVQPVKFLFIGRLLKEKGVFELIEAIRIVKSKYPNCSFTVLGAIDHENLGALKQETLDQLLQENLFEYPGYVSNVQDWIEQTSVFILPSYREGVPRSTQEAMAIGRPIITTDVPGCRDTVVDGVNGFLVQKWNVDALVEKMCFFIENPEQINIMGQESYKIACEKFDVYKVNNKLFKILGIND